ncbi:TPA: hypothetical protein ACGO07_001458 [Streptococcus suis]
MIFVAVVAVVLQLFFGERQHDNSNRDKGLVDFVAVVAVVF